VAIHLYQLPSARPLIVPNIYDSAPSPAVRRDASRLASLCGWHQPTFIPCPQQAYGSQECGLFAIAVVLLHGEFVLPTGTFSLAKTRPILQQFLSTGDMCWIHRFRTAVLETYGLQLPSEGLRDREIVSGISPGLQADVTSDSPLIVAEGLQASGATDSQDKATTPLPPSDGKCTATTQAKRGGKRCDEPCVIYAGLPGPPLCRLHLLLAHHSLEQCTAASRSGKRCSHRSVEGCTTCPFHISDIEYRQFLKRLVPATNDNVAPVSESNGMSSSNSEVDQTMLMALEKVDDPDFETELLDLCAPVLVTPEFDKTWEIENTAYNHQTTSKPQSDAQHSTLGHLIAALRTPQRTAHPLALANIRQAVKDYARCLRNLCQDDTLPCRSWPLIPALLEVCNRRRRARQWRWSTMLRNMCLLQGALQKLPLTHGVPAVKLSESAEWAAALTFAASQARSERPKFAKICTYANVISAIRMESSRAVRLLLGMSWLLCGRTGDVRQLLPNDVKTMKMGDANGGVQITVTFYRGKTIKKRGPYSLHTRAPQELVDLLGLNEPTQSWVPLLGKASVKDVLGSLRRVDSGLENRSVRRGALQALATAGVDEPTLLLFSGHAALSMLRRYLGWGSIGEHKVKLMTTAATALGPNNHTTVPPAGPDGEGASIPIVERRHNPYVPVFDSRHSILNTSSTWRTVGTEIKGGESIRPTHNGLSYNRWLEFLGSEAPPADELPMMPSQLAGMIPDHELPLHSKPVLASADITLLLECATCPELRKYAEFTFPWLYDRNRYDQMENGDHSKRARRSNANCNLSEADIRLQVRLGKYEFPRASSGSIKRWCRVFTTAERHKGRRRHLAEPLFNDLFSMTPTIHFASRPEVHMKFAKYKGGFGVTLDYASCFDLYGMSPDIRDNFGLRLPDGTFTRMAVLPMGFRPSAAVAQCGTWCVTDLPTVIGPNGEVWQRGVDYEILTYIDNIAIIGLRSEVVREVTKLVVSRSAKCGLRLNEHHPGLPLDWSPEPQRVVEYLGEEFDLLNGSVRQATKTHSKVNSISMDFFQPQGPSMTRRQVAAIMGLFLFASACCGVALSRHQYYAAMKYYRQQAACIKTAADWGQNASPMNPSTCDAFTAWSLALQRNPSLDLHLEADGAVTDILFTDASEERWSATHLGPNGMRVYAGDWADEDWRDGPLHSSIWSEPLAIRKAICRIIKPSPNMHLVIYTDHSPIVDAVSAPIAKTYSYWRLQCLLATLPGTTVVRHIPGTINPADAFTRGPLDEALERRHSPAWETVLGAAQEHHLEKEQHRHKAAEYGSEWSATARNPLRQLAV